MLTGFENIKSFTEAARIYLGINYYNLYVRNKILRLFEYEGIDIRKIIEENNTKPKRCCLNCGKELKAGLLKFCSTSCSATYNNKGKHKTEEEKRKISNTIRKNYLTKHKDIVYVANKIKHKHICIVCGKEFYTRKKHSNHCSTRCRTNDPLIKLKLRQAQNNRIALGIHNGWNSKNIKSYAERFWEIVLNNNNIPYIREDHSNGRYFLDFLIIKNDKKIDLEIDGKQHRYRKEHDIERDSILGKQGYIVYRIPWNLINTEKGKLLMKQKIEDFLNFYEGV